LTEINRSNAETKVGIRPAPIARPVRNAAIVSF
jgi:hypothetical protein